MFQLALSSIFMLPSMSLRLIISPNARCRAMTMTADVTGVLSGLTFPCWHDCHVLLLAVARSCSRLAMLWRQSTSLAFHSELWLCTWLYGRLLFMNRSMLSALDDGGISGVTTDQQQENFTCDNPGFAKYFCTRCCYKAWALSAHRYISIEFI